MTKRASNPAKKASVAPKAVDLTILGSVDAVEFQVCANSWGRNARESQQTALNTLASLGITTLSGKLTKRYA